VAWIRRRLFHYKLKQDNKPEVDRAFGLPIGEYCIP